MNKGAFYRYAGIISILLIVSLNSRGSVTLPLLTHKAASTCLALQDTIPGKKPAEEVEQKQEQPVKEVTDAVIKEVPKSKKQIKPIAIPPAVLPVKAPIIKPKIVIKKIGVRIP